MLAWVVCQLPSAVVFILRLLGNSAEVGRRLVLVGRLPATERELFRTDAEIWIAGWALHHRNTKKPVACGKAESYQCSVWLYAACQAYR